MPNFQLRFSASDIQYWADRYEYRDLNTPKQVGDYAKQNGHLDRDNLVQKGDPPALPGRHPKFDSSRNLIVTPKCEPPSTTQGRNHETSKEFKSHAVGV